MEEKEPTRVVTVRMPESLHKLLMRESHKHETSMNKLCIAKLSRPSRVPEVDRDGRTIRGDIR